VAVPDARTLVVKTEFADIARHAPARAAAAMSAISRHSALSSVVALFRTVRSQFYLGLQKGGLQEPKRLV
jgi:hypothetical protein